MEFKELLTQRYAAKAFEPKAVPDDTVHELLETYALPYIAGSALYIVILPDRHHRGDIAVHFCVEFLGSPHFLAFHREFAQRLNDSEKNLYNFLRLGDFPLQNSSETM